MSILRAKDYSSTPVMQDLRTLPGGGLVGGDWLQALVLRGYGWHFDVGAFATPIVGGGNGTTFDQDQPEIAIAIPSGYTMIPLRVRVTCKTPLIGTDADISEILLAADIAAVAAGLAGNGTAETPTNMRTSGNGACPLTCYSAITSNCTNPTLGVELDRAARTGDVQGTAANALWGELSLLYEPVRPPLIVGPAGFYAYWGGTVATSGYANVDFLAVPSNLFTGLS